MIWSMQTIYEALVEYVGNEKLVVDYLYVIYLLLDKYGKTLYEMIDLIKQVDEKLWEVLTYFAEEKFDKKDVYDLLIYAISKTGYNVLEIKLGKWADAENLPLPEGEKVVEKVEDDAGIMIKTADGKIYKRFVLDDVKKLLGL